MRSLEALALKHRILPVQGLRYGDKRGIDVLTERLAGRPETPEPWLPVGVLGPLLIMGHHNPRSEDFMSVPKPFRVPVLMDVRDYDERYLDFMMHHSPRYACVAYHMMCLDWEATSTPLPIDRGELPMIEWLAEDYPFTSEERRHLTKCIDRLKAMPERGLADFDQWIPQFSVALEHLRSGAWVFNPECLPIDPRLTPSQVAILREHRAIPLFEGEDTRYWVCSRETNLQRLETAWSSGRGNVSQVFRVLGEALTIERCLPAEKLSRLSDA